VIDEDSPEFDEKMKGKTMLESSPTLKEYLMDNFTPEERAKIKTPKHLYKVVFEKPGGIPMPIYGERTMQK